MTNNSLCVGHSSELTVPNPVGGFRTSYCGGPRFNYRSEISYPPSSISRKVGMQATADSFHIPSSCPPVQAVVPPDISQSAPRIPCRHQAYCEDLSEALLYQAAKFGGQYKRATPSVGVASSKERSLRS